MVINGFAPGSAITLNIAGQNSGKTAVLPFTAAADCSVLIGSDAASQLPSDGYQLRATGTSYFGRPLELSSAFTVR